MNKPNVIPFFGNVPKTKPAAAEFYAAKGWRLLPLWWMYRPGWQRQAALCVRQGRLPDTRQAPHRAVSSTRPRRRPCARRLPTTKEGEGVHGSNDLAVVKRWWAKHPEANIGFWLEDSGLAVLDVDVANDKQGDVLLRNW